MKINISDVRIDTYNTNSIIVGLIYGSIIVKNINIVQQQCSPGS